jgi:hypothetical protein
MEQKYFERTILSISYRADGYGGAYFTMYDYFYGKRDYTVKACIYSTGGSCRKSTGKDRTYAGVILGLSIDEYSSGITLESAKDYGREAYPHKKS